MVAEWKADKFGHWDLYINSLYRGYITNPEYHVENFKWNDVEDIFKPAIVPAPTLDEAKLIIQTLVMLEG